MTNSFLRLRSFAAACALRALAITVGGANASADDNIPRRGLALDIGWTFHLCDEWPDDWAVELPFDLAADRNQDHKALGTKYPGTNGTFGAPVPADFQTDEILVNGERQVLARYPNLDPQAQYFGGGAADAISPERAARWSDPTDGYFHTMHPALWTDFTWRIAGKDAKGELKLEGGWPNNRGAAAHKKFRFVENIFEELDARVRQAPTLPQLDAVKPIYLLNNRWRRDHGWAIDLDDGSSNYVIRNNLCLRGGMKNREGFGRVVENNVLVDGGYDPHVLYSASGDIFRRNTVWTAYRPAHMPPPPGGNEMDFNLVQKPKALKSVPTRTLRQQSGRDEHLRRNDVVLFVDDFPTPDTTALLCRASAWPTARTMAIRIFRDQRQRQLLLNPLSYP